MPYWKFLRTGARSPFTGFDWSALVGTWVTAAKPQPCVAGFHACRTDQLPVWMSDELWEIELGDPVVATAAKVVASRARLVRRVEAWDRESAHEYVVSCVDQLARHVAAECDHAGLGEFASELLAARDSSDATALRLAATRAAQASLRHRQANLLAQYLVDAIDGSGEYPPATIGYIAARAANHRSRLEGGDEPYEEERRRQATWLARRLSLPTETDT